MVVGQGTGIGLAIAKRLVEGGAEVLLTAGTARDRADAGTRFPSTGNRTWWPR